MRTDSKRRGPGRGPPALRAAGCGGAGGGGREGVAADEGTYGAVVLAHAMLAAEEPAQVILWSNGLGYGLVYGLVYGLIYALVLALVYGLV